MKIGVSLGISPREPISHTVEIVQSAEKLGFDSAWIADVQLSMKDCYVALALCAANTSTIRLGTGVTNPVTRHFTTIANGFTALNEVSNGRAIIGLGSGWTGVYSIGLKPATIKYLETSINNINTLCSGGEVVGEDGKPYRLTTAAGKIPIFVAANQPRILTMCGRVADGVIMMGGANEEFTQWQIDHVRRGAEEVGRDFNEIELHLWAAIGISDDRKQARDDVSHWVASQAETFNKWRNLPEFLHPFREDFQRASDSYDRHEHMSSHASHKAAVSDEFTDYVALVGSAEQCLERLRGLEKLGLHGVTLAFRAGAGGRQARMEALHEGIIRHLKQV
jgi:5,10-methylenetetrahydromethanopterin reductase